MIDIQEIQETEVRKRGVITAYFRAWRNIFTYHKRTTRYEFFSFLLLNILFSILMQPIFRSCIEVAILVQFASLFVGYALQVRRFHDIGLSGCWVAFFYIGLFIVPILLKILNLIDTQVGEIYLVLMGIYWIFMIIIPFFKGTPGKNIYSLPVSWKE